MANLPELEQRLRLLEDEQAILDTLYAYGHGLDYGDEQGWLDCWAPDAVLVWPGWPSMRGHAALRAAFRAHTHAPQAWHKHLLVAPRIQVDCDQATVQSMFARLDRYPSGPAVRSFGRYLDRLQRSADGRWRFTERIAEREATRSNVQ